MTDDASTAYICIYCPFNSDNLEALETHLTNAHGHGCQDTLTQPTVQSPSLLSIGIHNKVSKREAPDDEQFQFPANGNKHTTEHKRKRTLSPAISTNILSNDNNDNSEFDDGDESGNDDDDDDDDTEDDERDSASIPALLLQTNLTCPTCGSSYNRLGHLLRHSKRKHHIDLLKSDQLHILPSSSINQTDTSDNDLNKISNEIKNIKQDECNSIENLSPKDKQNEIVLSSNSQTNTINSCFYCDYKTADIEDFKLHIIEHVRDKNYRCLLCNRLYKYRGDCSFHIRRKHHRYSTNANDYIQRFVFDMMDADESASTQTGGHGPSINGSVHSVISTREQDGPARYFGCHYCDYTSNYGGDVRKHQVRKHPNLESKVIKIVRQDSERQNLSLVSINNNQQSLTSNENNANDNNDDNDNDEDDDDDDEDDNDIKSNNINNNHNNNDDDKAIQNLKNINLIEQSNHKDKIKTVKTFDKNLIKNHASTLPLLPNFAPVRVFQCSVCHQQGTYKWVVERHIRAKHPDQADAHVIEIPAELGVKVQKISQPLKRFRCSLCPLQSKHTWVIIRHIKHFHTLQTASVLDMQTDGTIINDDGTSSQNGDSVAKSFNNDSEASSISSLYNENAIDEQSDQYNQQDFEEKDDENESTQSLPKSNSSNTMKFTYKCSLCDFTSCSSSNIQKHINDLHSGQTNVHILTQPQLTIDDNNQNRSKKKSKYRHINQIINGSITKVPPTAPLSPKSALAKARFPAAIEEALLSLKSSKLNPSLYSVQPKFGIKRLKCRHCFYRSNWKTDMIRHVRIRHNLNEPDHHKDMITMSEQEARATIETYENTFGKELRRRTFRTWSDWSKAEEEFTPKDGSLQYTVLPSQTASTEKSKPPKPSLSIIPISTAVKPEIVQHDKPKVKRIPSILNKYDHIGHTEFQHAPNQLNIVPCLVKTNTSMSSNKMDNDDAPLDLSLKPSSNSINTHQVFSTVNIAQLTEHNNELGDVDYRSDNDEFDETSTVTYSCSACPYKHSLFSKIEKHLSLHLNGQGISCPVCSYTTLTLNSMNRHMNNMHPTSQPVTKYINALKISTAIVIEQHQCPTCPYQCERSDLLDLHRHNEHDDECNNDSLSCGNDDNDENNMNLPVDTNNNLFQCPLCSLTLDTNNYSNLEQFTMHIFTNHDNQISNNQSCPFCSFIVHSTSQYTLVEHMKLHFNGTLVQPDPLIGIENVKELLIE